MTSRSISHAWFDNERGTQVPGESLFLNKFRQLGLPWNYHENLKNYLDPATRPQQRQPQSMPSSAANELERFDIYVGQKTKKRIDDARAASQPLPNLKVSILWGVGSDLDNLGLRYYFEQVNDRVLVNVSGKEAPRWNIGISGLSDSSRGIDVNQVGYLFSKVGMNDVPRKISVLAAYSTGYGGLVQSVNESLLPLADVETVLFYDCTYRTDKPIALPADGPVVLSAEETNSGGDEVDKSGHAGSAFNTQRARARLKRAMGNTGKFVAYMATSGGSPLYLHPTTANKQQYTVDFSTRIDLRAPTPGSPVTFVQSLFALVLTRVLGYALTDGQVTVREVPQPFRSLAAVLPARGQVASTSATLVAKAGFSPATTLLDWGKTNKIAVLEANKQIVPAIQLISARGLMYPLSSGFTYPSPGNEGGALHAGLIPEFGWEFLL